MTFPNWRTSMCDYSLELYRSRPAAREEQYTLHRFPSGTMGFVAGSDCETAVCMPAGGPLHLQRLNETRPRALSLGPPKEVGLSPPPAPGPPPRAALPF